MPTPTAEGEHRDGQIHALVLSFPLQGHITPLMQLARRLIVCSSSDQPPQPQGAGVYVTFVLPEGMGHDVQQQQQQHLDKHIDDHLQVVQVRPEEPADEHHEQPDAVLHEQKQTMKRMEMPVERLLANHSSKFPCPDFTCVIADVFVTWSWQVAQRFGLPLYAFYTANATSASVLGHAQMLLSQGVIPAKEASPMVDCIPGVRPFRMNELPRSMQTRDPDSDGSFQFSLRMFRHVRECAALLLNTVYEMEPQVIDALKAELGVPVYAVGPLLFLHPSPEDVPPGDRQCLAWLDSQAQGSVLYICFGTVATYSQQQLLELALGIEASKQPFLWAIRNNAVETQSEGDDGLLPRGFLDRTKGRGLVVPWAPQVQVLAHPAVGGFLTHCGWNSILESLAMGSSEGVPMLCWPSMAEQKINRKLLVRDWRVALDWLQRQSSDDVAAAAAGDGRQQEEVVIGRDDVERAVRLLFDRSSSEGARIRRQAAHFKSLVRGAVNPGGSAYSNLQSFIRNMRPKAR